jgi:hypothetical protein
MTSTAVMKAHQAKLISTGNGRAPFFSFDATSMDCNYTRVSQGEGFYIRCPVQVWDRFARVPPYFFKANSRGVCQSKRAEQAARGVGYQRAKTDQKD